MAYQIRGMSPEELAAFLGQPHIAVIGTVDGSGRPRSTPIWYQWEDGAAHMFTFRDSLKWRNLKRTSHASLCIDRREPPSQRHYAMVTMDGPVEETNRPLYDLVLAMALRYYGPEEGRAFAEDYREDRFGSVSFRLIPRRILSHSPDTSPTRP
jgi:PPOX class probable F420-dependent enzyme